MYKAIPVKELVKSAKKSATYDIDVSRTRMAAKMRITETKNIGFSTKTKENN
jgi:hypothetical protein